MKKLLLILTFVLFSFGANAKNDEYFDIAVKKYPAKECLKALEKGKYVGKYLKNRPVYLLDGVLYVFTGKVTRRPKGNVMVLTYEMLGCQGSKKIY